MNRRRLITTEQFDRLVAAAGLDEAKSIEACRLVLVVGKSINGAAKAKGVAVSTVSRMLKKIPTELCPTCGQPIK